MSLGNLQISITAQFAQPIAITPAVVPASSVQWEGFEVKTLTTEMSVYVSCPTLPNGIQISGAWVSAKNTLTISFWNLTGLDTAIGTQVFYVIAF